MKIALFLLTAMAATTASAQQMPPAYGQVSSAYGSTLPDVTNNAGFANRRFDASESKALPTFKRHAARAHAVVKKDAAAPSAL